MPRVLASHVHVLRPDSEEHVVFEANEEPPAWARKLITNPAAWVGEDDGEDEPAEKPASKRARRTPARGRKPPEPTGGDVAGPGEPHTEESGEGDDKDDDSDDEGRYAS